MILSTTIPLSVAIRRNDSGIPIHVGDIVAIHTRLRAIEAVGGNLDSALSGLDQFCEETDSQPSEFRLAAVRADVEEAAE